MDNVVKAPAASRDRVVIVVAGIAGTGKTTLGRRLARTIDATLLDLDSMTNPLLDGLADWVPQGRHWNDPTLREQVRSARYAALRLALADQSHRPTVCVAPFTQELQGGQRWLQLVEAAGVVPIVVWLAGDAQTIAQRRATRAAVRDAVSERIEAAQPQVDHLRIDISLSTQQQQVRVLRHLGYLRALPVQSALYERRFAAALFDLDGTLVDSTAAVNRSWNRMAREYGLSGDALAGGHGRTAAQVVADLFPPQQRREAFARVQDLECSDVADVIPIDGSPTMMASIPTRAIVTSATGRILSARLAASGLDRPDVVVTADDVEHGKPNPEAFLSAAKRLGVAASDCVVFEDAPAGIEAARAAGCSVVAITGSHNDIELARADVIVDRLDQLEAVLDGDVGPGVFHLLPSMR